MAQKRAISQLSYDTGTGGSADYLSLALKFEADLVEMIKDRNGLQNAELIVQHTFSVFDKCIPELGQFVRVMKVIRDQLYDAVYSEKFTECGGKLGRLPFFKIIESTEVEAEKRLDVKSKDVDTITKRLFEKQLEYESLEADFAAAGSEIRKLQQSLMDQRHRNKNHEEKIAEMEVRLHDQQESAEEDTKKLQRKIAELKHTLDNKNSTIRELEKYRKGHQDLDNTFFNWPTKILTRMEPSATTHGEAKPFRTSTEPGRHEAAQTISRALATQIEELEKQFVEGYEQENTAMKTALTSRRIIDNAEPAFDIEEQEMTLFAKKAVRAEHNFMHFMTIATRELDMIRDHEQNMASLLAARMMKIKQAENQIDPDDRSKDVVPTEPVAEAAENPFVANDVVISKYSIIVQVSQDGIHFYDLPVNEPCGMCGLPAVLVCPHHILSRQITVPLSPNTSYLRIVRPVVRSTTADIVMPPSAEGSRSVASARSTESEMGAGTITFGRPKARDLSDEKSLDRFAKAVDGRVETKLLGTIPRELNEQQMYAFCEDLLAYLYSAETSNPPNPSPLIDHFFTHLELTYRSKNAAHLVANDVAYSLPMFIENDDRYLQLFCLALNGVVDPVLLKYAALLADATLIIDWRYPTDYWAFALVVYPFLDDEDADVIQMNFNSFTEGRVTSSSVLEYQLFCLLRGTELRYQQMYEHLYEISSGMPFTEEEFVRTVRDLLPRSAFDFDKIKALFQEAYRSTVYWSNQPLPDSTSTNPQPQLLDPMGRPQGARLIKAPKPSTIAVDFYKDALSVERAAQILCYVDMLGTMPAIQENMWTKVLEMRSTGSGPQQPASDQVAPPGSASETESIASERLLKPAPRLIVRYRDVQRLAIQQGRFKLYKMRENMAMENKANEGQQGQQGQGSGSASSSAKSSAKNKSSAKSTKSGSGRQQNVK